MQSAEVQLTIVGILGVALILVALWAGHSVGQRWRQRKPVLFRGMCATLGLGLLTAVTTLGFAAWSQQTMIQSDLEEQGRYNKGTKWVVIVEKSLGPIKMVYSYAPLLPDGRVDRTYLAPKAWVQPVDDLVMPVVFVWGGVLVVQVIGIGIGRLRGKTGWSISVP